MKETGRKYIVSVMYSKTSETFKKRLKRKFWYIIFPKFLANDFLLKQIKHLYDIKF